MSAIWDNDEIQEKLLMLSPDIQETFLRAVDALHYRESDFMLTFIQESRDELLDTQKEIVREQEVLRDTSDLLASKRIYGDPDEEEDDQHEMNAVDDYLRRRNQGDILGILSFEDERRAKKKAKKKEKEKDRRSKSGRHSSSDRLSSSFNVLDETLHTKQNDKKEKKHREKKSVASAWGEVADDSGIMIESGDKPKSKEKEKQKENKNKKKKDKKERRSSQPDILDSGATEKPVKFMEREKTLDDIQTTSTELIEQETNKIMKEYLGRESSNLDQKNQFEEAMMRRLAKKKSKHAAEADEILQQQMAADRAVHDAKADYEAKMMAKLRAKRERSNMSRADTDLTSTVPQHTQTADDTEKPKKEKKKKKSKDKDNDAGEVDDEAKKEKKEKKKKKKKDKDKEKVADED